MRELEDVLYTMGRTIDEGLVRFDVAVVSWTDPDPNRLRLRLSVAGTASADVVRLASYTSPQRGDKVLVLTTQQGYTVVLGKIGRVSAGFTY